MDRTPICLQTPTPAKNAIFFSNDSIYIQRSHSNINPKTKFINSKQSTRSHVPNTGVVPLLTTLWSFLFHPVLLGAAPPVVPVRRSPTEHADSSASTNLRPLPLSFPRWQRPPGQPPTGVVLHQPRQRSCRHAECTALAISLTSALTPAAS